jgi:hypothetical protein
MSLGYTTQVVNGQMVPVAPEQAFNPLTFGQAYTGPAMWPRQGVYNVPPVMPSAALQNSESPMAYGATGFPVPTTTAGGKVGPFSITKSPLPMALIFLAVGLLMLTHIHYRG